MDSSGVSGATGRSPPQQSSTATISPAAITRTTYLGAAVPGRFCPNFAYHLKLDSWPTDSTDMTTAGFLSEFDHLPFISWQAQQHDRIPINLHQAASTALLPLHTREQLSSASHKARTPAYTILPARPRLEPVVPSTIVEPAIERGSVLSTPQRPVMPPGFQPFSPSPSPTTRSTPGTRPPPNRHLNLGETIQPIPRTLDPVQSTVTRYNPITATVYTLEGRAEASDIFINCCRLAAHHSNRFTLINTVTGTQLPTDSNLFV
jgi:hypothetical protein